MLLSTLYYLMCDCASLSSVVEDTEAGIMCCVKVCLQRWYCTKRSSQSTE